MKYISGEKYTNRYRDVYWFELYSENVYTIRGDLNYWRSGSKDMNDIDTNDYGFIDPSGGPFLQPGFFSIDGKECIRIFSDNDLFCFEVK